MTSRDTVARTFRDEYGRAVAVLIRVLGDIDLAEDAVQEAFAVAVERWPRDGVPPGPAGWIITTARNRAIDRLRRESTRGSRELQARLLHEVDDPQPPEEGPVEDERLRLIFTCCHPALSREAQVALTLRLLGGLTTTEIARAFLVPEATMGQRISRAKRKIRDTGIPYRVPRDADLPDRLSPVLAVLYLVLTEGHTATAGPDLGRPDLAAEAIRLARLVVQLMPDEPEAAGLLALMLLSESRRAARTGATGDLVVLADQDRTRWDEGLAEEGRMLVRACIRRGALGPYQLQAAIQAVHSEAGTAADTDWARVLALYDQLLVVAPTEVVRLNRAVALAEVEGGARGLEALDDLDGTALARFAPYHVARAELLARAGRPAEAVSAFELAVGLTGNESERTHLRRRLVELDADRTGTRRDAP